MKRSILLFIAALIISLVIYGVCFAVIKSIESRYLPLSGPYPTAAFYEERQEMYDKMLPYQIIQISVPLIAFTVFGLIAITSIDLAGKTTGVRLLVLAAFVLFPIVLLIMVWLATRVSVNNKIHFF